MVTSRRLERIRGVLAQRQPDLTLLLDRVHKPHNLSAIARSCDAVGVQEIHSVPVSNPREDRAVDPVFFYRHNSAGAGKWLDLRHHDSLQEGVSWLKERGFAVWAADEDPQASPPWEMDLTVATAFVLGSERSGLDRAGLQGIDGFCAIPMYGMTRSLNVSVAAAILLFEAARQRQTAGFYQQAQLSTEQMTELEEKWLELPKKGRAWHDRLPRDEG